MFRVGLVAGALALLLGGSVLGNPSAADAAGELSVWSTQHVVDTSATFTATGYTAADDFTVWLDEAAPSVIHALPYVQDTTGLVEGVHVFHLSVNGSTASYDFVVDHSDPVLTVVPTDGATDDTAFYPEVRPPSWHIATSDTASSVTVVCSTSTGSGQPDGGACSTSAEFIPALSFGTNWTLTVTATDEAGHSTTVTRPFSYTRHPDAPAIEGPPVTGASAAFAFRSTLPDVTYQCRLEGAAWAPCTSPMVYDRLAGGTHTFWVRNVAADDTPGLSNTLNFTTDVTAPTWLFTSKPADLVGPHDAPLRWSFTTVESHPTAVECSLTLATAVPAWAPCTTPFLGTPKDGSGAYAFRLRMVDAVGNAGSASRTFTYDATPPRLTVSAPVRRALRERAFTLTADEAVTARECRLDAGAWTACAVEFVATGLADGRHVLSVRATDRVGLVGTASRTFDLDGTAPRVSFDGRPARTVRLHGKRLALKTVALRADEAVVLSCQLDGGAWYRCAGAASRPVRTATVSVRVRKGTHHLKVRGIDAAGNQSVVARTRWFVKP